MIEASQKQNFIFKWIAWHYFEVPESLIKAFRNFLVFNFNYFSVSLLCRTLFSHWRRYRDSYGKGFDPKTFFFTLIGNTISRVLGALVRFVVIVFALILEVLIFISGIICLFAWIFFPLLLLFIFWSGLQLCLGI